MMGYLDFNDISCKQINTTIMNIMERTKKIGPVAFE